MSAFWDTYQSTAQKLDVKDQILVLSPQDTHVSQGMRRTKATGVTHEWLTIVLNTASAQGLAANEGDSFTYASADMAAETRRQNRVQTFVRTWKVAAITNNAQVYGRTNDFAFRKLLAMKAWKIGVEVDLLDNSASAAGASGAGNWRIMNGLRAQDGLSATAATSGSAPVDEENINSLLQLMFEQEAAADKLVCAPYVKRQISRLVGVGAGVPLVVENGSKILSNVVDIYESDFGRVTIIPSLRLSIDSEVIAYKNEYCALASLREPFARATPNDGDFESGAIVGDLTFEYLNVNGLGRLRRVQSAAGA